MDSNMLGLVVNGGAAGALIFVVVLFLRFIKDERTESSKALADKDERHAASIAEYRDDMRTLVASYQAICVEVVKAVQELKNTIHRSDVHIKRTRPTQRDEEG